MGTERYGRIAGTVLSRSGCTEAANVTDRMSVEDAVRVAIDRVNEAIAVYQPVCVTGALSGGHDSLTACFVAAKARGFTTMFHIDTGVGLQANEDYIRTLCQGRKWPLSVYHALENTRADVSSLQTDL